MKRVLALAVVFQALTLGSLYAEDLALVEPAAPEIPAAVAPEEVVTIATPNTTDAPTTLPVQELAPVEPAAPVIEAIDTATDNLEFISGEITAMDEVAKTVTVKMYGETAENEADKMLTVTVDANTDITDGEQDRELKTLAAGTEVDVEYDPAAKKATYIFVY